MGNKLIPRVKNIFYLKSTIFLWQGTYYRLWLTSVPNKCKWPNCENKKGLTFFLSFKEELSLACLFCLDCYPDFLLLNPNIQWIWKESFFPFGWPSHLPWQQLCSFPELSSSTIFYCFLSHQRIQLIYGTLVQIQGIN